MMIGWSLTWALALAFAILPSIDLLLYRREDHPNPACIPLLRGTSEGHPHPRHPLCLGSASSLFLAITVAYLLADCAADAALVGLSTLEVSDDG